MVKYFYFLELDGWLTFQVDCRVTQADSVAERLEKEFVQDILTSAATAVFCSNACRFTARNNFALSVSSSY